MQKLVMLAVTLCLPAVTVATTIQAPKSPAAFQQAVGKGVAVVKFFRPTCPSCKNAKIPFEKAANEIEGVTFIEVNQDLPALKAVFDQYQVEALPTIVYFKDGVERPEFRQRGFKASMNHTIKKNVESLR